MVVHPTSTATPIIPITSPATLPFVRASPIQTAATTAANSAVVALSIAAREAVRLISGRYKGERDRRVNGSKDQEFLPAES